MGVSRSSRWLACLAVHYAIVICASAAFAQTAVQPASPPVLTVPVPAARSGGPSADDANHFDSPATTARKAGEVIEDLSRGDVKALRRGPLLLHGNYCGIGGRPGLPPVDVLDAACMRHDACTKTGALPNCACNERLQREATAIVEDPRTTPELKTLAAATAAGMAVLICK